VEHLDYSLFPGCMHSTIESAKAFCEPSRVQGTVFYIDGIAFASVRRLRTRPCDFRDHTDEFLAGFDFTRLTALRLYSRSRA